MLQDIIYFAVSSVLLFSALTDLRTRTIYNSASGIVLLLSFLSAGGRGEISASSFIFLILAPFFYALWVLRILGGGDVKLLAALIPLVPPSHLFGLFFSIALAGAVLAIFYVIYFFLASGMRRCWRSDSLCPAGALQVGVSPHMPGLPYGVAIAVGTIANITNLIG